MSIRDTIFNRATTHAGLSAKIGNRCYPKRLPESPIYPCLTYSVVGQPPTNINDHAMSPTRWAYSIQLDVYADNPDEAREVGDEVFDAFNGFGTASQDVGWSFVNNRFEADMLEINADREVIEIEIDHVIN